MRRGESETTQASFDTASSRSGSRDGFLARRGHPLAVLDRVGLERSYGDAVAYNFYGPPRLTLDIDVLVLLPAIRIPVLIEELASGGCHHRDPEQRPIELAAVLEELRSKARFTTFVCRGVRVEICTPWHSFHHRVLRRSLPRELHGRSMLIHSPEDLVVFKKIFDLSPDSRLELEEMLDDWAAAADRPGE